ncbi:MAG TPA: ATP-dependent DNA ligase [Methanobacteriaceae archaeon]|nr:ATP-dependent DNA ligase [Methanobacteriaceae archaeon]
MMIEPMLAKLQNPDIKLSGNWISEPKYDGERLIAESINGKIALWTRRHVQVSKKFPEIVDALKKIKRNDWILDGELTAPGGFRRLLKRNVVDQVKIKILSQKIPTTYHVFDILRLEGEDLTPKPLAERKKILINILTPGNHLDIIPFQVETNETMKNHFQEYVEAGFEGTVLKNINSPYQPGKRTGQWIKIKREETVDVNVIGATQSTGSIPFGALILEKDGKFFGKVGTGYSEKEQCQILKILKKNQTSTSVDLPESVENEVLLLTVPLPAEIKVNELYKGSPRAPVWVRFRWG